MSTQIATRVDDEQAERFRELTRRLGTTPSDSLRMFVSAFNAYGGFPYEVRVRQETIESFSSEEDATDFSNRLAIGMLDAAR